VGATAERPSHRARWEPATSDGRFQKAFDKAAIGMALADGDGRGLEVNDALSRITGFSRDELKATTLRAMTHPDDVALDTVLMRDLLSGQIPSYQVEKRYRHAGGHYLWVLVTVSLVRDDQGQPLYVISQVQDISQRMEHAERLEYLVDHDFLTGLFNQRRFEQELTKEVRRAARYGSSGALVLVDVDKFKDVNDAFGHKVGDELLEAVALALSHRMRQTDVLARVGGDEFAVLLPQTSAEQARVVAEGIVAAVRDHVAVGSERSIRITASVGVALFGSATPAELMDNADRAMYDAKAAGRDGFAMFGSGP
jgi:diguanylate cyclase (GGDEF)-like protein/PAS domain S-box-containing protein